MKKKFIESSLTLIKKNQEVDKLKEKKLKYGLEGFYNLATKLVVILILSFLFHTLTEFILLTIIYGTLRLYGFGIHMKTSIQCWFTTLPLYIGGCLLIKYCLFPNLFCYFIWVIGYLSFLFFAPADTPSRPLIHPDKRRRAKIFALMILTIYAILYFITNNLILNHVIIYAVLLESISINPLTYKLFHTPFNNYKKFQNTTV